MLHAIMAAALTAGAAGSESTSIVAAGDSATYEQLAEPFDAVGTLGGLGTGTLVAEQWVVTAAHVTDFLGMQGQTSIEFELSGGDTYTVESIHTPDEWIPLEQQMEAIREGARFGNADIALLKLSEPVTDVTPIPLGDRAADDAGIMLVGIGYWHNDPDNGIDDPRAMMTAPRDTKRAGTNRIDAYDPERLEYHVTFSPPTDDSATEHEVSTAAGDSGGPALLETDAGWTVVGVIANVDDIDDTLGNYGDRTALTAIFAWQDWIEKTIEN